MQYPDVPIPGQMIWQVSWRKKPELKWF